MFSWNISPWHCSQAFLKSICFCSPASSTLDQVLKIVSFYFFFFFFFLPLLFPFHYQSTAREWETEILLCFGLSVGPKTCVLQKAVLLSQRPSSSSVLPCCLASPHERKTPTISPPSSAKKTGNDAWMCNEISEMCTDFLEICQLSNKKIKIKNQAQPIFKLRRPR